MALVLSCLEPWWGGAAKSLEEGAEAEEPELALSIMLVMEFLFWKLRFLFRSRPHVATLMFIWSGLGILPCCRKILRCLRSFGFRVIIGFRNLIC